MYKDVAKSNIWGGHIAHGKRGARAYNGGLGQPPGGMGGGATIGPGGDMTPHFQTQVGQGGHNLGIILISLFLTDYSNQAFTLMSTPCHFNKKQHTCIYINLK